MGASLCKNKCPIGHYKDTSGTICKPICASNQYRKTKAGTCIAIPTGPGCAAGTYKNASGDCVDVCKTKEFRTTEDSLSCVPVCKTNEYRKTAGKKCTPIPGGATVATATGAVPQCTCPNGSATSGNGFNGCEADGIDCSACDAGYHLSATAGTGTQTCIVDSCTCPNGTATVAGGTGTTLCENNGNNDCSACGAGYLLTAAAGTHKCVKTCGTFVCSSQSINTVPKLSTTPGSTPGECCEAPPPCTETTSGKNSSCVNQKTASACNTASDEHSCIFTPFTYGWTFITQSPYMKSHPIAATCYSKKRGANTACYGPDGQGPRENTLCINTGLAAACKWTAKATFTNPSGVMKRYQKKTLIEKLFGLFVFFTILYLLYKLSRRLKLVKSVK